MRKVPEVPEYSILAPGDDMILLFAVAPLKRPEKTIRGTTISLTALWRVFTQFVVLRVQWKCIKNN